MRDCVRIAGESCCKASHTCIEAVAVFWLGFMMILRESLLRGACSCYNLASVCVRAVTGRIVIGVVQVDETRHLVSIY